MPITVTMKIMETEGEEFQAHAQALIDNREEGGTATELEGEFSRRLKHAFMQVGREFSADHPELKLTHALVGEPPKPGQQN